MFYRVNTTKLQIRSGPGISYDDIGDLFAGDRIETSGDVGGWLRIAKIIRVNGTTEVRGGWCHGGYCIPITPEPPTQPPAEPDPDFIVAHWVASGKTRKYIPE